MLDFDQLCDCFQTFGLQRANPAEVQGLACGFLAAGFQLSADQWLLQLSDYLNEELLGGDTSELFALWEISERQFLDGNFGLQLCLPDDELYGLAERSNTLALWCQGFLHGFAAVQTDLSVDSQELLRDLAEISKIDISHDDLAELYEELQEELAEDQQEEFRQKNEADLMELEEFVRMAATSLFMDYHRGSAVEPTAH